MLNLRESLHFENSRFFNVGGIYDLFYLRSLFRSSYYGGGFFMLKIFAAIDRHSRWILLAIMLLFIITGLGITKNIMDQRLAKQLHENILPIPFYVLLLLHVFYPLPANLVRWKAFKSETVAAVYVCILATIFLGLCLWLHFR